LKFKQKHFTAANIMRPLYAFLRFFNSGGGPVDVLPIASNSNLYETALRKIISIIVSDYKTEVS
jgi:hypothetical protein